MNVCNLFKWPRSDNIARMIHDYPDFEVNIRGHKLLSVAGGKLLVDGKNYGQDMADLSAVISTLTHILQFAGQDQTFQ